MQDLHGMNMETEYDHDWESAQQTEDERIEKQEVTEAFNRIYLAVNHLEVLYNCGLPDLRKDVRFVEMVLFRK